jgi:dihydrofolate reductase
VVSSTMEDPRWQNTTILHGDLHEEVTRLKSRPGKDIVATGSITLVHELIKLGLVDEYRLFIYPVVAGQGRRLFENATSMLSLRLGELQRFGNGITLAIYRIN